MKTILCVLELTVHSNYEMDWRAHLADFGKEMLSLDDKALALWMQYADWKLDRIVSTVQVALLEGSAYEIEVELTNYFAHDSDIIYNIDKTPGVDLNSIDYFKSKGEILESILLMIQEHFYEDYCACEEEDSDYVPSGQEDSDSDDEYSIGYSEDGTSYYRDSDSDSSSLCEEFAQTSLKRSLDDADVDVDMPPSKLARMD